MNSSIEHNTKMAETLRSLSDYPVITKEPVSSSRRSFVITTALGLGLATCLTGGAVLFWPALLFSSPQATQSTQRVVDTPMRSAQVALDGGARQPLVQEVTGSGYVLAPQTVQIYARRSGVITKVLIQPGTEVKAGQILFQTEEHEIRFAAEEAMQRRHAAELILQSARIHQTQTQATLTRQKALSTHGIVALQNLEDAQTANLSAINLIEQAKADLEQADLAVRIAQERVAELTVRAPISGTVIQQNARVGDTVPDREDARRDGAGLVSIARLEALVIEADVAEKNLNILQVGLMGEAVLDAYPDHPFAVEIERVAPEVNAAKGTISLRLVLHAPPPGVRPGMAARIRLTVSSQNSKSLLPTQETDT